MRKILLLVPDLNHHGYARQASLLATHLPHDRFSVEILGIDGAGPLAEPLRAEGIVVEARKVRRALNIRDWFALRQRLGADPPDILHAFGLDALREIGFAMFGNRRRIPPIVVSLSLTGWQNERSRWWSRGLLGRAGAIVVANERERERSIARGFPPDRLHTIKPGVSLPTVAPDNATFRTSFGIPTNARLILSVGEMTRLDRMHAVYWGFDILHYVDRSIHALLIGDGPARQRTETNARSSMFDDYRIHFLGSRPNAAALLPLAELIWVVPGSQGGTYSLLEGMAAGRPVVATALPHLSAIVKDGETGLLIPPSDPPALARVSHKLLQDDHLCRSLGEAARAAVETSFRVEMMVNRFAEVYDSVIRR